MALRELVLTPPDAIAGLKLSSEAGWNQVPADWEIFIRHGTVFGLADDDTIVATAAILPYDRFGFVGMVLVTPAWQKRGLATRLMEKSIAALRARDLVPALDATPAGAVVYGRLGFQSVFDLCRWQRTTPRADRTGSTTTSPSAEDLARLDQAVFGCDRRFLFAELLKRPDTRVARSAGGFAMTRNGHRATQLGPLIAPNESVAIDLLAAALADLDGPVFLDLAERCSGAIRWLEANGFTRQRPFHRMIQGDPNIIAPHAQLIVTVGPEFG
jgi:GNAT superfamily N-acetyltransferase